LHNIRKYKLVPDLVDWRDRYYDYASSDIKESVDMRSMASGVQSQRDLGSCTAQAIVAAYELLLKREQPRDFVELSPLFVYYNARIEEGTINEDAGAYLRSALKAVDHFGICAESVWPYDVNKFDVQPPVAAYEDAKKHRIKKYKRLSGLDNILDSLSSHHPVVTGIMVYSGFENITGENPVLPMPSDTDQELGAHAILLVGYDLPRKQVLAQNSFGSTWGQGGYFWIPFEYIQQELTDAWVFDIVRN
jgi:C1A family cysteine protease